MRPRPSSRKGGANMAYYPDPFGYSKSKQPLSYGYASRDVKDNDVILLPTSDYKIMMLLTAIGAVIRLFRIYQPSSVVFDEVHFGGFATKYIKGQFFMDVHPPLAKLLIALVGLLAGFRGEFNFKDIHADYLGPGVPYVAMRLVPAIMGILTIPVLFLTLKAYGCRTSTASFGATLLAFENGLITHSRFILLDSPLVLFTALTALSWVSFTNQHEQGPAKEFEFSWWFWLISTGISLGLTCSVKWVGLFTIAWVGLLTLGQLWTLLGDAEHVTPRKWFNHFFARALCLIVIPVTIYTTCFAIHFLCLQNPGDGDGFMSSQFQATLNNKGMDDVPADVAFGSRLTIRHANTQGGNLHSHPDLYPTGSKQQQITLYPHKDENNIWILENQTQPLGADGNPIPGPLAWDNNVTHVQNGALIRLFHPSTHRRLHSHNHPAPVSDQDWQKEASAYGFEGFEGDNNDVFQIKFIKDQCYGDVAKKRLRTLDTKFKLVHVVTGCSLFSHKVKLPAWGFEQQEVTCATSGSLPNSIWYVETNEHPSFGPDIEKTNYRKPGFFGKFWELHKVMWKSNAGLTDSHNYASRPSSWPVLTRGINFWGKNSRQVYLLGNPIIWWTSTVAIGIYVLFKGIAVLRWQRHCGDYSNATFRRFDYEIGQTVLGWALHYFPFYLMARQLFLHHYFPALYFAIIAFCQLYDFAANRIRSLRFYQYPIIGKSFIVLFACASFGAFILLSPLIYANPWTRGECDRVSLLNWDFDCRNFHTSYAQYSPMPALNQTTSSPKPSETVIESLEYRDQNGHKLSQEEAIKLAQGGDVALHTRYETRSMINDHDYVVVGSHEDEEKKDEL